MKLEHMTKRYFQPLMLAEAMHVRVSLCREYVEDLKWQMGQAASVPLLILSVTIGRLLRPFCILIQGGVNLTTSPVGTNLRVTCAGHFCHHTRATCCYRRDKLLNTHMSDETRSGHDVEASLAHWVSFGRKGNRPEIRATANTWNVEPFEQPQTAEWDQPIAKKDVLDLLMGFIPSAMEDKWFIYTEGPDDQGRGITHMHRSWTGQKCFELNFSLDRHHEKDGWKEDPRFVKITWAADVYAGEQDAKKTAADLCRWCLNMQLSAVAI